MNTNSDDILLLKLIKQGDQIAFRHLFYQYADSLERFITYYIHDREKSQDLVLDIFTYIWENRQNFEIKLTLKAYLFQAARNKSFTYIRDKKIPVYLEEMEGMEIVQNYDSELELQELHHLIEEAVSLLPDKCREIFRKSREENLTNKEIAGQLHISEKTVEGQITIALKKIRIHLGDSYCGKNGLGNRTRIIKRPSVFATDPYRLITYMFLQKQLSYYHIRLYIGLNQYVMV